MTKPDETVGPISDRDTFDRLTENYHHELAVHCYRILGSLQDSEDAVQESLLRAWRRLDSLKDPNSLRAWLYRIATNVSLDMLDGRKARLMPPILHLPADPQDPLPAPINEPIWLEPLPMSYVESGYSSPEARYEVKESLTLAFLTLLQQLPGRQRVILILRDVMGWRAQEVAELLNISVAAVNSALQRARATLNKQPPARPAVKGVDHDTAQLLTRYVSAWESADTEGLIALLREDAILTMPPFPVWYHGRAAIKDFFDARLFVLPRANRFRLAPVAANGAPAFIVFERDDHHIYRPGAIQILTVEDNQIARIDDFLAPSARLLSHFNIPTVEDR